jgi:hypothetical protein
VLRFAVATRLVKKGKGDASAIPFLVPLSGRFRSFTNDRLRV